MGINYQPHLFDWISAINSILTDSMITLIHMEIVMKVQNYNIQSIHGISRRPLSKYHGIKALTLQTFLHKIKSRIMWLYKQVVLLTVYQLWPCNNKTGPLFFTNAKALLFSSTNFSKLSWIPHQTTKQSTPPLLLSWILEQTKKKSMERKPPPGKMEKKQEPQQIHHLYQQIPSNAVKCIFCVKKQMNLQPHKDDVSESLASNCPGCQDVKNDINPCNCWNTPKPVLWWPTVTIRNVFKQKPFESTSQRTFWGY